MTARLKPGSPEWSMGARLMYAIPRSLSVGLFVLDRRSSCGGDHYRWPPGGRRRLLRDRLSHLP